MAKAFIADSVNELLKNYSPVDLWAVDRAIVFLEDDSTRESNKIDFVLVEEGYKVWGLQVGYVWLAFLETDEDSVKVVQIALTSRFRIPGRM